MSTSTKAKVFLFGATGQLGASVLHFLTNATYGKHFEVCALIREETLESKDDKKIARLSALKSSGVHFITGDANKADNAEIAKWIYGFEIVISCLSAHNPALNVELKLLESVKLAGVPWFIPSVFGSDVTKAFIDPVPPIAIKAKIVEAVKASKDINYILIFNYGFMEFALSPLLGVDIAKSTVTTGVTFEDKISTITVPDIAHLTVEALFQRNEPHVKNQILHFVADTVSFEQITKILEKKYNKKFNRVVIPKDKIVEDVKADIQFKNIGQRFRWIVAEQRGMWIDKNLSWNAQHAKHIKVATVQDYVDALQQ